MDIRGDIHRYPSSYDVPNNFDWEDIKLWGRGIVTGINPAASLAVASTIAQKRAIENKSGQSMTPQEVNALLLSNGATTATVLKKSVDTNIVTPLFSFFSTIKWVLIVVVIVVLVIKFK